MENAESAKEWYVTHEGKQFGPVSIDDLKYEVERGELNPRLDMVWKQDMEDWIPAGDLEGLFEKNEDAANEEKAKEGPPVTKVSTKPTREEQEKQSQHTQGNWEGTSRGTFLLVTYILPILLGIAASLAMTFLAEKVDQNILGIASGVICLVFFILILFVSINRFPNLGMSRWWWFGLMVPILSLWVNYRMIACPAGYAEHKKLDGLGWVLAIFYWLVVLLVVIAFGALVFVIMQSPEEFKSLGTPEEISEHFRNKFGIK